MSAIQTTVLLTVEDALAALQRPRPSNIVRRARYPERNGLRRCGCPGGRASTQRAGVAEDNPERAIRQWLRASGEIEPVDVEVERLDLDAVAPGASKP